MQDFKFSFKLKTELEQKMKKKFKVSDNVNGKDKNVCVKEIKQETKQDIKQETKHEEDIHPEVEETIEPGDEREGKMNYTTLTNFSTKYLMMCKVHTDVGRIKYSGESRGGSGSSLEPPLRQNYFIFIENFQKIQKKNKFSSKIKKSTPPSLV